MVSLDPLATHPRPPGADRNLRTDFYAAYRPAPPDLREAYAFARRVVAREGRRGRAPGHRLVWVRRGAFAAVGLVAAGDAFAIVGRHTRCTLVLPDDPAVALRHLLVRSISLPSGGLALRVFDLQTTLGFVLPDGSRQIAIFAEGPIAIGVGDYALVALPEGEGDLPGELPPAEMKTPAAPCEQLAAMQAAMSPYRVNARPAGNRLSRITLMPRPRVVGEAMPPSLGRLTNGGAYALTLSRGDRSATVSLADDDLRSGVILGRSEKCHSEMLRRITDVSTSRTHLLLLAAAECPGLVHAYDLASTQGTFHAGAPARRVVLADGGTALTLGRGEGAVHLSFRRVGL